MKGQNVGYAVIKKEEQSLLRIEAVVAEKIY